jgi:hypothetical protein
MPLDGIKAKRWPAQIQRLATDRPNLVIELDWTAHMGHFPFSF